MKYENFYVCKCNPKQTLPHTIHSGSISEKYLSWHYAVGKVKILFCLTKRLSGKKTCDGKISPVRKYRVSILDSISIEFGGKVV